ncbi:MAG: TetR/AcrR family transcriptional regulator, partial [Terriglobales bacterium]
MPFKTTEIPPDRQILDAAAELFFEHGFTGTGINAIGQRIGVSGPAVYGHFRSKDEILARLALEGVEAVLSRIGPPSDDPGDDLAHLVRIHVQEILRDRSIASIYVTQRSALTPELAEPILRRLDEYRTHWIETLQRRWPQQPAERLTSAA